MAWGQIGARASAIFMVGSGQFRPSECYLTLISDMNMMNLVLAGLILVLVSFGGQKWERRVCVMHDYEDDDR